MLIHSAVITGSVQLNNTDVSSIINVAGFATTSSVNALSSSIVSVVKSKMDTDGVVSGSSQLTSSFDNRYVLSGSITQTTWDNIANKPAGIVSSSAQIIELGFATTASVNDLQSKTGSYATTSSVNNLQSVTGSYATTASFDAYTGSNDTTNTTQNTRLSTIESRTGSFATTGSNTFIGTNVFTGSVFITSDLIVQGSSSLQNITASAVSIGTNTVILNTNTPILQFGGISVQDSGSTAGRSGSLLWNSINDHWINVNPSGSDEGYNSAMIINGPKNTGSLGAELGLTEFYIPVSQGEDHITDSIIFQSGSTNIGIGTITPIAKLDVAGTSKFGTTSANTHQFTGSILASGSIQFSNSATITTNAGTGFLAMYANGGGLYFGGAASTNQMMISSSGNVGIGTTTPDRALDIYSASAVAIARVRGNTTNGVALTIENDQNAQSLSIYAAGTSGFGLSGWAGNTVLESQTGIVYSAYNGNHIFQSGVSGRTERMRITSAGVVQPGANGTQDLGTSSLRWATIYTSDLSLSNGIGDYTIVEGEEKLYLYNNKNNKVYSFVLQEEDPLTATPKKS